MAGAAAGKVFAEVDALARLRGGRPETFAGLAGAGDLVATVVAASSRNRRAGELLAQGVPGIRDSHARSVSGRGRRRGPAAGAVARDAQLEIPALDSLAALVEGRIEPERWTETVTEPVAPRAPKVYPRRVGGGTLHMRWTTANPRRRRS